ncbi:hypothetical protein [Pseudomonas sessilinigenes]|uniref:hypothetical protein n=1 Tax=Pseudomonas sessilinigenes TaxID=658629 RepID=UPI000F6FCA5F|nr:hypothetical protein [Pseudomonas sessilinigenes]AZC27249.1 hypothetical protein C4K39_5608 [Pseudomonas sessilinigenes]
MTDISSPGCPYCSSSDHESAYRAVLDTLQIMGAHPEADEDRIVELLQERGYSPSVAEKLNVFVPTALGWPLLKRLGVEPFGGYFIAYDEADEEVQIPVSSQHYFIAALKLAYCTLEHGYSEDLPLQVYEHVIGRSAEINAVNKALAQDVSVEGGTLGPLKVLRIRASDLLDTVVG